MAVSQQYWTYQLLIDSELVLPELLGAQCTDRPDVVIRMGYVGNGADAGRRQIGPYTWCTSDELWLGVPKVGRFLIRQGSSIVIQVEPGADEDSVRLFLLGSAIGALLAQRGLLVLHGNAIRIGDQCLVCVGASGVGKSTLAGGFLKRGYSILADDVVPIDVAGRALPGFPRIKLWRDSADRLGVDTDSLHRLRPGLCKFNYPLGSQFERQPVPVRWIYQLDKGPVGRPQFHPTLGMQRFMPLLHNTYRRHFVEGMGRGADHLKRCGDLAGDAHVVQALRPNAGFDLDGLIEAMLVDMQERG